MNEKFNVVKNSGKMNKENLIAQYKEIIEEGEGYIIVYKNKKDNRYYYISNGLTQEEGLYAANLIADSIMRQDDGE